MDNEYKFYNFLTTFMNAISPSLTQKDVGTWLFSYADKCYGVREDDLTHAKNQNKIPKWLKDGINCKPGSALVKRFRNGLQTNYKLVNPQETISKFTHIIEGASNITAEEKKKNVHLRKRRDHSRIFSDTLCLQHYKQPFGCVYGRAEASH